jgi:four helix bundle protein
VSVRDQVIRAAKSIPANIAEGYGRGRTPDGVRFLRIARASAVELESHLRVAVLAGRLPASMSEPLIARTRRVRALIGGLLRVHATRP